MEYINSSRLYPDILGRILNTSVRREITLVFRWSVISTTKSRSKSRRFFSCTSLFVLLIGVRCFLRVPPTFFRSSRNSVLRSPVNKDRTSTVQNKYNYPSYTFDGDHEISRLFTCKSLCESSITFLSLRLTRMELYRYVNVWAEYMLSRYLLQLKFEENLYLQHAQLLIKLFMREAIDF